MSLADRDSLPTFMNTDEVAEYLRVSPATVRAWIKTKKLPPSLFFKLGGTYRFRTEGINAFLQGDVDETFDTKKDKDVAPPVELAEDGVPEQLELDFKIEDDVPLPPGVTLDADEDY